MSKSIYSNIDKKEKRAYRKMYRKHRKEMIRLAKEDRDFDWSYLHDLVITKIKHMYEYYHDGNNVWQTDETRIPILDQLSYVLDLQYELDHLYDDLEPAIIDYSKDGSWTVSRNKESATKVQALLEKESELYKSIYSFIGEHIEEWWD
jgi:hypothetical protein